MARSLPAPGREFAACLNWPGLGAYAAGTLAAFGSPWIAPLVGIGVASLGYVLLSAMLGGRAPVVVDAG